MSSTYAIDSNAILLHAHIALSDERCNGTLGNALWLSKAQSQCLILWRKMPEWAAALHQWALSIGMQDAVTSVEEIIDGEDSHGTGMLHDPRSHVCPWQLG